jgi:hypothetical protein
MVMFVIYNPSLIKPNGINGLIKIDFLYLTWDYTYAEKLNCNYTLIRICMKIM